MKTLQTLILSFLMISFAQFANAQTTEEKMKVSGECGMCKGKIEKAAKQAGATYAVWNPDSKELVVKYDSKATNAAKIQQSIAGVGYDTPKFRATDEAYSKLHECCKYERTAATAAPEKAACCANGECCKDGKCTAGGECCKDGKCTKEGDKSCCAEGGQCKHEGEHAAHAKIGEGAACCKKG